MNYIVYDLEATCWEDASENLETEIIEIGAFRINEFGDIRGKFSRFVRPVIHPTLSPFCRQLTTISQFDVNKADTFPDVIEEFQRWGRLEEEDYILCSWGNFDRKMFIKDCRLHRLDHAWAERHANLKEQYKQMKRMRTGIGLQKALSREGIEFTGVPHRGISDAENLVKLFLQHLGQWSL